MARTAMTGDARTYLPDAEDKAEMIAFVAALVGSDGTAPDRTPMIVGSNGQQTPIPETMVDVLLHVGNALRHGGGVNVSPLNAMLTTQEGADYLGISRPTLVRILERGEIPMEKPGRHRYVRLRDLIDYSDRQRQVRREALAEMVQVGEETGLYEATEVAPPPMR